MSNTKHPPTIHIFGVGTHSEANSGKAMDFSQAIVDDSVAVYDPELYKAPLVIGHPKTTDMAYGHVSSLSGAIEATTERVDANFAEMVNDGRFNKISSSFYRPESPHNPVPGSYYLRHVGFFGAYPVAVKGMPEPSFSESENNELDVVNFNEGETEADFIEFAEMDFSMGDWSVARLGRNLREWLIERFGKDEADKVVPSYVAEDLEDAARNPITTEDADPVFSETSETTQPKTQETPVDDPNQEADFAEKQTQLENDQKAFDKKKKDFADKQLKAIHDDNVSFCEEHIAKMPGQVEVATALLDQLSDDESADFSDFAEGDDESLSPRKAMMQFIEGLDDKVDFNEVTGDDDEAAHAVDFASPEGYEVDADQAQLLTKANAYMAKHDCDFATAASAVGA